MVVRPSVVVNRRHDLRDQLNLVQYNMRVRSSARVTFGFHVLTIRFVVVGYRLHRVYITAATTNFGYNVVISTRVWYS